MKINWSGILAAAATFARQLAANVEHEAETVTGAPSVTQIATAARGAVSDALAQSNGVLTGAAAKAVDTAVSSVAGAQTGAIAAAVVGALVSHELATVEAHDQGKDKVPAD